MSLHEPAVTRGMSLLSDEEVLAINLDTLQLSSCNRCVVGQLLGEFNLLKFMFTHDVSVGMRDRGSDYGFCLPIVAAPMNRPCVFDPESFTDQWAALTSEWKRQLTLRREAIFLATARAASQQLDAQLCGAL